MDGGGFEVLGIRHVFAIHLNLIAARVMRRWKTSGPRIEQKVIRCDHQPMISSTLSRATCALVHRDQQGQLGTFGSICFWDRTRVEKFGF